MDEAQVGELLLGRAQELSNRVVAVVWERVPGYEPPRILRDELSGAVRPNIETVLRHLIAPAPPSEHERQRARGLGTARALQGIPLDVVMQSFRAAERVLNDAFIAEAGALSTDSLRRGLQRLAAGFDRLGTWSVEAYRQTQDELTSHYDRAAGDLVAGLVAGDLSDEAVNRQGRALGLQIDAPCQGLALRIGGETAVGPTAARLQRKILGLLGSARPGRIVVGTARAATIFLSPGHVSAQRAHELSDLMGQYPTARIGLGPAASNVVEGGRSCQRAIAALDASSAGGIVVFDDVLLEVLVRDSAQVAERLRERLAHTLEAAPHLSETIVAFFAADMSIRHAATALHLHPNSVAYRLRRVHEVTGLDPRTLRDLLTLRAAVHALSATPSARHLS